jgi:hypothetical protein
MNRFNKVKLSFSLAGACSCFLQLSAPSDSSEQWHQGQTDLQRIYPRATADVYSEGEDLGYKITATNAKKVRLSV